MAFEKASVLLKTKLNKKINYFLAGKLSVFSISRGFIHVVPQEVF